MTDRNRRLENLQIQEPCTASWKDMPGSEQKRHCDACDLHVHNLSAMQRRDAEALLAQQDSGQRICVRVEYTADGQCVTAETPTLPRTSVGRIAASALALGAGLSSCHSAESEPEPEHPQTEETVDSECTGTHETLGRLQLLPTMGEPVFIDTAEEEPELSDEEALELLGKPDHPVILGTPAPPLPGDD
jgi:hypothetical protein